ncbi:MAG: hypothetical protein CO187_01890, partial [Zetaproteobacteria bacterium CG_4_9_14_3_um_filter_53_7]
MIFFTIFRSQRLIHRLLFSGCCLISSAAYAADNDMPANRYLDMSLEDIMAVEVSSASRKQELLS